HRFGISYHRLVRGRSRLASEIDGVAGVGPARRRALLKAFGSVAAMRGVPAREIARRAGVPEALALRIAAHLAERPAGAAGGAGGCGGCHGRAAARAEAGVSAARVGAAVEAARTSVLDGPPEAFLDQLRTGRRLSPHTLDAYARDLRDYARFALEHGLTDWR